MLTHLVDLKRRETDQLLKEMKELIKKEAQFDEVLFKALVSHFSDRVSEYLCFGYKANFSLRGFIR